MEIEDVGCAGVKGFVGGFGRGELDAFGETAIKMFVDESSAKPANWRTGCDRKADNIDHLRQAGVLVMGLTYNLETSFGSGVLSKNPTGLPRLGHEAVARMNARGVSIEKVLGDNFARVFAETWKSESQ